MNLPGMKSTVEQLLQRFEADDDADQRENFLVWCPDEGETEARARIIRTRHELRRHR